MIELNPRYKAIFAPEIFDYGNDRSLLLIMEAQVAKNVPGTITVQAS